MELYLPVPSNISVTCQMNNQSNLPLKNIYIKQREKKKRSMSIRADPIVVQLSFT